MNAEYMYIGFLGEAYRSSQICTFTFGKNENGKSCILGETSGKDVVVYIFFQRTEQPNNGTDEKRHKCYESYAMK